MKPNFSIHSSKLRAVIELAYAIRQQRDKHDFFSVQEIAQTVEPYGIKEADLIKAHQELASQQHRKQRRTNHTLLFILLVFLLLVSTVYQFSPKEFIGHLDVTLTSEVNSGGFPLDKRHTFQILRQQKVYAVLNFHQVALPYDIRWEIRDSQNKLVSNGNQKINRKELFQTMVVSCPLSFASEIGTYQLLIFADDNIIQKKEFNVEYGALYTNLISDNQMSKSNHYSKSNHERLTFKLQQVEWEHSGGLEWRWIAPDKTIQKHTIQKVQKNQNMTYSDTFEITDQKTGTYHAELWFRNVKVDEKKFEIIH